MPGLQSIQPNETPHTAQSSSKTSRATWPDAVAFQEAIQNPALALRDGTLAGGRVAVNRLGLPLTYTGRFAAVFRVEDAAGNKWALRCFTSEGTGTGRAGRYEKIARHLESLTPALRARFVPFDYQTSGVRVGGHDYPLLVMGWAKGVPLGKWVEAHRNDAPALRRLCRALSVLVGELEAAHIAHGDLQHDNLLIDKTGRRVVLVDYDGVWIPALTGQPPGEMGHPNYQHPARQSADFGPHADRFSLLVLQTALYALSCDPTLWDTLGENHDDALLFSRDDFAYPDTSPVFSVLRLGGRGDATLFALLDALQYACVHPREPRPLFAPDTFGAEEIEAAEEAAPIFDFVAPVVDARSKTQAQTETVTQLSTADGHKWWVQAAQKNTKSRARANRIHRRMVWTAVLFIAWLCYSRMGGQAPVATSVFVTAYFESMLLALAYFFWPENTGGQSKRHELNQAEDRLNVHHKEVRQVERHLSTLNANPANQSIVAFVNHALETSPIFGLARMGLINSLEVQIMERNNIRTLAQIPAPAPATPAGGVMDGLITEEWLADLPKAFPGEIGDSLRERLLGARSVAVKQARLDFDALSKTRRELQREVERLKAEEAGLVAVIAEMRNSPNGAGGVTFARFLGHLIGA